MGCFCSKSEIQRPEDIYASLVIPKPPPLEVTEIKTSSDDDIPLFAPVDSDDDKVVISDTGIVIDDDDDDNKNEGEGETEKANEKSEENLKSENDDDSDQEVVHFDQVDENPEEEEKSEKNE